MTKTLATQQVCIVGLGLMGGSLAMALRGQVGWIAASDTDPDVIDAALGDGVIDGTEPPDEADIVVLAVPTHRIVTLVKELKIKPGALVIDLGSTKRAVCTALDGLPDDVLAVGGHPLCGLAENGFRNATGGLYRGARFVLCETARTTPAAGALAESLAVAAGAVPLWMEAERHDRLTALTSHLPHLLSFGLMALAMEESADDPDLLALAAGGFDGATRLARTDAAMIAGMLSTNADNVRRMAAALREHLARLEALLDDAGALQQVLGEVVSARRAYTGRYGERKIS